MDEQQKTVVVKVDQLVQKFVLKRVLNGLSFELHAGEAVGIFGLRGSGKSSLLHILAGVDRFTSGNVEVLGCNVQKNQKFKERIGLVTQEASLFQDLNTAENLDFIATLKGAERSAIKQVIDQFELGDYLKVPVPILDGGVYQRLSMACALLNSPQLLILDEPVKDIDLYSRHLIIQQLTGFTENGGACICGFSNIEFASYFDRVGWLENGELSFCEPQAACAKWEGLLHSFGEAAGGKDE